MHWFDRIGYNMIANAPQLVALGLAVGAPFMAAAPAVAKMLRGGDRWWGNSSSSSSSSSGSAGTGMDGVKSTAPAGDKQEDDTGCTRQQQQQQQQQEQQQGLTSMVVGAASRTALQLFGAFMHPADRQTLHQQPAALTQLLPSMLADSVAQGSRGLFHDMRLFTQPWDIDLQQISAPTLVFQGEADVNVTVAQAQWLAGQVQGAQLHLFPGQTHFSLVGMHAQQILGMVKTDVQSGCGKRIANVSTTAAGPA
jgi:pimeloyl-ACP methyl ester carboxylesterase